MRARRRMGGVGGVGAGAGMRSGARARLHADECGDRALSEATDRHADPGGVVRKGEADVALGLVDANLQVEWCMVWHRT